MIISFNRKNCFKIGQIRKTHGYKGEFYVSFESVKLDKIENLESVFVEISEQLVPFFFEFIEIHNENGLGLCKFTDISDMSSIERLIGKELHVPNKLRKKYITTKIDLFNCIGFSVIDNQYGNIGIVTQLFELPANDLLEINNNGKEVLIPVNENFILNIDFEKKLINSQIPEGLLEL